jgi:hypothetical protein
LVMTCFEFCRARSMLDVVVKRRPSVFMLIACQRCVVGRFPKYEIYIPEGCANYW